MNNVDRALIIRRRGNQISEKYAQDCVNSLERNNTPFEFIDAIQNVGPEAAAQAVGLEFNYDVFENSKLIENSVHTHQECLEMGNFCCTASHVKSWRRIVEIGKPCAVLEHDAVVMRNFRNFDVIDNALIHLGPRMRDLKTYIPRSRVRKLIQIPQAIGTHAYVITPKTAEILITKLEINGLVYGVDHYMFISNASKIPIYAADPPPAVCYSRESTMTQVNEKVTSPRGVWGNNNDKNMPGQITPGLVEGLGCPLYHD